MMRYTSRLKEDQWRFTRKGGEMKTLFYLGIAVLCVITGNRHMKYKFCRYWLDERRFKAIELKAR